MTYNDVYELISDFCPQSTLVMFVDGWGRFPQEPYASKIINSLETEMKFWQERGRQDRAEKFQKAIREIRERLN